MKRITTVLLLLMLSAVFAQAQIGKLRNIGKNAGGLVGRALDKSGQSLQEKQFEKDTTTYSMVLALSDNASSFDTKADGQNLVLSAMKFSGSVDTDQSRAELAMDYNRSGFKLYNLNRLQLAETKFYEALMLFFQTEWQARRQQQNRSGIGDTFVLSALYSNLYKELQLDEYVDTHSFSRGDFFAYLKTLSNLGLVNHSAGRYRVAERYALKALEIAEENFGAAHPATAAAQNNLAMLRKDQGSYTEAEQLMVSAEKAMRQAKDEDDIDFAILLNNKAMLFQAIGRYEAAEKLYKEAIGLGIEDFKENNRDLSKININLALLYQDMGRYLEVEKAYDQLIAVKQKRFGTNSPDYAYILNSKAALLVEMDRMPEAAGLLEEALSIYQRKFGEEHPSYASTLYNLGWLNLQRSDFSQAREQLEKAYAIRKDVLGGNHPGTTQSLQAISVLEWQEGQTGKAAKGFEEVLGQYLYQVREHFPAMSEHEKAKFWAKISPELAIFQSFAVEKGSESPELLAKLYDLQLATKGILLSSTTRVRQLILKGGDEALKQRYLAWLDQKEQLANYYAYSKERLAEEQINLDSLETLANQTEKELSAKSELFSRENQNKTTVYADVAKQLSPTSVAVEVIRLGGYQHGRPGEPLLRYIALVAKPGQDAPTLVVIENGAELEDRYFKFYKNAVGFQLEDEFSYEQFWKPLEPSIGKAQKVYFSADGVYHQINPNTFQKPDGHYVIDGLEVVGLSSTRALVEGGITSESAKLSRNDRAALFGFPDYGEGEQIEPLPGTKVEIEKLNKILKGGGLSTNHYMELAASEEQIKAVAGPTVLHVATHGFFLEDLPPAHQGRTFGIQTQKAIEQPLLRSGLMLAGAEAAIDQVDTREIASSNNGILTAYETMGLPLDGTKLVVLSACETGLGDIRAGEGVYGLQRALQIAGAQTVVMSLWKVSDEATQALMASFYEQWLKSGHAREAFRAAQLSLKKKYPEPYFWGAFVMVD